MSILATGLVTSAPAMTPPAPENGPGSLYAPGFGAQRQFKKHKVLPRPGPRNDRGLVAVDDPRPISAESNPIVDTALASGSLGDSQPPSPKALKHDSRKIGTGPDLPPTPPSHSRTSSSSHSALPSSPTIMDSSSLPPLHKSAPHAIKRTIATPPDQRSPPTPDVTPPGPAVRPRALRPSAIDRGTSRFSATDSRTESFKTAREEPLSSEDEGAKSTVRPALGSTATSKTMTPRISDFKSGRYIPQSALDFALKQLELTPANIHGLYPRELIVKFDRDWGTPSDVEQQWDDNLERVVTTRKRSFGPGGPQNPRNGSTGILEHNMVTPTNATEAVRHMSLHEVAPLNLPPKRTSDRRRESSAPSNSEKPVHHADTRRASGHPTKSNPSTIVEAILIDVAPQRRRTLRHVQKRRILRESRSCQIEPTVDNASFKQPVASLPAKQLPETSRPPGDLATKPNNVNSISSGRARRQVWKNGGIPVIVVPDRRSSSKGKPSREPSLRSASSRRSRGAISPCSSKDSPPGIERQPCRGRGRAASESNPWEQRTMDFPPSIPARSSSLSAPTSRNVSRAGSLTADSIRALDEWQQSHTLERATTRDPELDNHIHLPEMDVQSPTSIRRDESQDLLSPSRHDDAVSKKYSSRNTPFSIASYETTGTAPEVSEAFAVHMYPHQNSSILVVNHSGKPAEASETTDEEAEAKQSSEPPTIRPTSPAGGPVTPPLQHGSLDEVDSPLRNPRPPPQPPKQPPAINFIPATPSGVTPAEEKLAQLGNYYEAIGEKPPRRPSIVRRALSRRRHSVDYPPTASKPPGLLTRTFSLSRNVGHLQATGPGGRIPPDKDPTRPRNEDAPADLDRLHPYWRPQWSDDERPEYDGHCSHSNREIEDEIYRYPPVDNRPRTSKRSLGQRMKRTFAIFPIRDDEFYPDDDMHGPERRTIRRTPSGNLRVVRRRVSTESLRRHESISGDPWPLSDKSTRRGFWRSRSLRRRTSKERIRRSSFSSRLEEIGIQNLPRVLSERRREKRMQELRQMISGPKDVRDGVSQVIGPMSVRKRDNSGALI